MPGFPNKAGDHADTDDILRAELKAAGIPTLQETEGQPPEFMADMLRRNSGEVKTSVIGYLHGWEFKRAWYYWMCSGPGIELAAAERLQKAHGKSVRASGDCGCRGPRFWFKGLACGSYHVDSPEGLKALADTIRELVDDAAATAEVESWTVANGVKTPDAFSSAWMAEPCRCGAGTRADCVANTCEKVRAAAGVSLADGGTK